MTTQQQSVQISAPNLQYAHVKIRGTAPYVQHKFSAKARQQIIETQKQGSVAKSKRKREPKDFDEVYRGAMHLTAKGKYGIPAAAFRSAMIDACRLVGFKMTHAKLSVFIEHDDIDDDDGTPLVFIKGRVRKHEGYVRLETGVIDIRVRPMWREWTADLRIKFDADQFSTSDVINLLHRAGAQVGVGEGRPNGKKSHGCGWGTFEIEESK